jgi:hypothetical protein
LSFLRALAMGTQLKPYGGWFVGLQWAHWRLARSEKGNGYVAVRCRHERHVRGHDAVTSSKNCRHERTKNQTPSRAAAPNTSGKCRTRATCRYAEHERQCRYAEHERQCRARAAMKRRTRAAVPNTSCCAEHGRLCLTRAAGPNTGGHACRTRATKKKKKRMERRHERQTSTRATKKSK